MRKLLLIAATAVLLLAGCTSFDVTASKANLENVELLVAENNEFWTKSDKADSVKAIKKMRNREALRLANAINDRASGVEPK